MLDGFFTPALDQAVRVGGDVASPLDPSGFGVHGEVVDIIRMRDGQPSETGSDVRVLRADDTYFDIVNTPITFAYKIDPMDIRLTDAELRHAVQVQWAIEKGTRPDARGFKQHKELMERAMLHGQADEIEAGLGRLRAERARVEADQRLSSMTGLPGPVGGDEPVLASADLELPSG